MSQWCGFRNEGGCKVFQKWDLCEGFVNLLFEGSTFKSIFNISISRPNILMSKHLSKVQKCQIYDLVDHGVIWPISKITKIRDQGMGF